jgi:hypothetical protein
MVVDDYSGPRGGRQVVLPGDECAVCRDPVM